MAFDYKSSQWKKERQRALIEWYALKGGLCERCGRPTDVPHVHHINGTEHADYEVLCPDCHAKHHGIPRLTNRGKCRDCYQPIKWRKIECRWVPLDPATMERHQCSSSLLKPEAKEVIL